MHINSKDVENSMYEHLDTKLIKPTVWVGNNKTQTDAFIKILNMKYQPKYENMLRITIYQEKTVEKQ